MKQYGVGVVGCGNISDIYLKNINDMFQNLKLVGVADLDESKANAQAEKYSTKTHRMICEMALKAGKHVYVEKPLSLNVADGKYLLDLAKEKGLLIGGAPDTFLGGGISTCRKIIQEGWIGDIIGCNAFMLCHGHESWHPDPEFYYEKGGGPMYDMGPYYLTALAKLVGPVATVAGMTKKGFDTRRITSEKKFGKTIEVEVPTHVTGMLSFENGAVGYITTSFDVWGHELPRIEIYGTKGTLSVPDPNTFGGPVRLLTENDKTFREMPLAFDHAENSRGYGISDMAQAIENGSLHEASGALTYHVLEVMDALHKSWNNRVFIDIESRF